MLPAPSRPIILQGAIVLALAIFFGVSTTNIKIDDAYIFYTYVRNIANGAGWVFNQGEFINGTTSALYPALAAILTKLGASPEIAGHWIGVSGLSAALLLLLKQPGPWPSIPLLLPLILLNSKTLDDAVGMETYLTQALLLTTLTLYLNKRLVLASFIFGLAVMSRPDSLLFGGVLGLDFLVRERRLPSLSCILPFLIVTASWLIFNEVYFGAALPNTIGAKLAQSGHAYWGGEFGFLHGATRLFLGFRSLALLAPLGVLFAAIYFKDLLRSRAFFLLLAWGAAYFCVYAFILEAPPYRWYYVPLVLPLSILILLPISKTPLFAQAVFAALLVIGAINLSTERWKAPITLKFESYRAVAEWLNNNAAPQTSVAAMEIGVVGYYLREHRVIDALGLITPAGAAIKRGEHGWFIKAHNPDYVITNNPPRNILEEFARREWFKNTYELKTTVTTPRNKRGVRIYQRRYQ